MKKYMCFLLFLIQMVCLTCSSFAQEVAPCADEVFSDAYINLTSGKAASYTAVTYHTCAEIKVIASCVQQKIDGVWVTIAIVSVPGTAVNTFAYTWRADCSGVISSGTYRVVATFSADGHTVTRTSNERTY